jgi:hypothetical protein
MTPTNTQGSEQELRERVALAIFGGTVLPKNWETDSRLLRVLALIKSDREARLPSIPSVNDAWCVACGHPTLILGNGGYITCSLEGCPDPAATHDRLTQLSKEEKQS